MFKYNNNNKLIFTLNKIAFVFKLNSYKNIF